MKAQTASPAHADRQPSRLQLVAVTVLLGLLVVGVLALLVSGPQRAYAAGGARVGLGTATSYSVLAGSTVTNTGTTVISDDVGVSPGTAIVGFPPGATDGTIHSADGPADQAQVDLTTAYNDAAGRNPFSSEATELGGRTLRGGVYRLATAGITGRLTLDGQNDPNSVFIFQVDSTLITAVSSQIALRRSAQACNVFWKVSSSATLGTGSRFVGTIMALQSISVNNGATVDGRALARNGAVTLDDNVFTSSACNRASPSPSSSASPSGSGSPSAGESPSVSGSPSVSASTSTSPSVVVSQTRLETDSPTVGATESQRGNGGSGSGGSGSGSGGSGSGGSGSGGSGSSSSAGTGLAATGGSSLTSVLGVAGLLFVLAGIVVLVTVRFRSRPRGRH